MTVNMTLHRAVRDADTAAVFALIRDGSDANQLDADGKPPAWYVLGDVQSVSEDELEQRQAILRMLELHGARLDEPKLRSHLVEQERTIFRRLFGIDVSAGSDETAVSGDLGKVWLCDVARTSDGVAMWLVDHPSLIVLGMNADEAEEKLFEMIGNELGDYEPNLKFVGNLPELI